MRFVLLSNNGKLWNCKIYWTKYRYYGVLYYLFYFCFYTITYEELEKSKIHSKEYHIDFEIQVQDRNSMWGVNWKSRIYQFSNKLSTWQLILSELHFFFFCKILQKKDFLFSNIFFFAILRTLSLFNIYVYVRNKFIRK